MLRPPSDAEPWLLLAGLAVAGAAAIWLFLRVLRWILWLSVFALLAAGAALTVWLLLGR